MSPAIAVFTVAIAAGLICGTLPMVVLERAAGRPVSLPVLAFSAGTSLCASSGAWFALVAWGVR